MILRREQRGQHPAAFRSLTGLTVQAFDGMLPGLLEALAAAGWTAPAAAAPQAAATPSTSAWPTSSS